MFRWREAKHNLDYPPQLSASVIASVLANPLWTHAILTKGTPSFPNILRFAPKNLPRHETENFMSENADTAPSLELFHRIRDAWDGFLLPKGILSAIDLDAYKKAGADGAVISNHGGRQCDSAPATIEVLPQLRSTVGSDFPLIADGGCWTGMDVARYLACGADFVLAGRAPYLTVAAGGGVAGAEYFAKRMTTDFENALIQLGCPEIKQLPKHQLRNNNINSHFACI